MSARKLNLFASVVIFTLMLNLQLVGCALSPPGNDIQVPIETRSATDPAKQNEYQDPAGESIETTSARKSVENRTVVVLPDSASSDNGERLLPNESAPKSGSLPATIALLAQANSDFLQGNLAKAESVTERAVRLAPSDPVVWYSLGRIRYYQNDYRQAISLCQKSIALQRDNLELQIDNFNLIADAYLKLGDQHSASDYRRRATSIKGPVGRH